MQIFQLCVHSERMIMPTRQSTEGSFPMDVRESFLRYIVNLMVYFCKLLRNFMHWWNLSKYSKDQIMILDLDCKWRVVIIGTAKLLYAVSYIMIIDIHIAMFWKVLNYLCYILWERCFYVYCSSFIQYKVRRQNKWHFVKSFKLIFL